jgi:hypothetical protein
MTERPTSPEHEASTPPTADDARSPAGKASTVVVASRDADVTARPDDPPVVTRLVIEIRSDGSRTIARGAAEHVDTGEKVAIEVEGKTPLALALSLVKTFGDVTSIAKSALGAAVGKALPHRRGKSR